MVTAGVFVFDKEDRVLLHLRSDNECWAHPGGFMELGESVEETARREVFEETGLRLGALGLFGIYSGPDKEMTLPNGDEVACVDIMFTCREFEGRLQQENEESLAVKFFPLDALPPNMFTDQQPEFRDLLSKKQPPFCE